MTHTKTLALLIVVVGLVIHGSALHQQLIRATLKHQQVLDQHRITATKSMGLCKGEFTQHDDISCSVRGVFRDTRDSIGWAQLHIESSGKLSDERQAYALGFLEGSLTHTLIEQFHRVIVKRHPNPDLRDFWERMVKFMKSKIEEEPTDEFWKHVGLVLKQVEGLVDGYNSEEEEELDFYDFMLMNGDVENFDIDTSFGESQDFSALSRNELITIMMRHSRCSALIKWTGDDVLVGHTTWEDYIEMNRIFKSVKFNFEGEGSKQIAFTGYPGLLSSTDDFIVTEEGLLITETTISILKTSLLKDKLDPDSTVATWIRSLVGARLSRNAEEYIDILSKFNSGTNNDQWLVVDYNKVDEDTLEEGAIWMLELIPGFEMKKDITDFVREEGYWASFNRPFFEETREQTMYGEAAAKHGEVFTYEQCPRAKIFKREQENVDSIRDMKRVIRLNQFDTDSFSDGCPDRAIAARSDLEGTNCAHLETVRNNGGIDGKVISKALAEELSMWLVSGPSCDDQPCFRWDEAVTKEDDKYTSFLPQEWNFDWTKMELES